VTPRYRRLRPSRADDVVSALVSGLLGAGVAAAAFYVTRLFLVREVIESPKQIDRDKGSTSLPEAGRVKGASG